MKINKLLLIHWLFLCLALLLVGYFCNCRLRSVELQQKILLQHYKNAGQAHLETVRAVNEIIATVNQLTANTFTNVAIIEEHIKRHHFFNPTAFPQTTNYFQAPNVTNSFPGLFNPDSVHQEVPLGQPQKD